MTSKPRYTIPVGTVVSTRNLKTGEKAERHVTRKELRFNDRPVTGYNGLIYCFQHGLWEIAVKSELVE